jgi:aspartate racemase
MAQKKVLGILGGMGPLASLAFLRTIYEHNHWGTIEQAYPDVILHSLASIPDRTRALLSSSENDLAAPLISSLRTLAACGVSKIIICCFTSHALIHRLPDDIKTKIVSLVDLTARELLDRRKPALLLASLGSYQKEVFKSTAEILKAQNYILSPDEHDKRRIHCLIYDYLKPGRPVGPVCNAVKELLAKYRVDTFIAGCTEFHLLSRHILETGLTDVSFVDPLVSIARWADQLLAQDQLDSFLRN